MSEIEVLVKETTRVKAGKIRRNPHNWRVHTPFQREVLRDMIRQYGFASVLYVYEDEDGQLVLIDGEARLDQFDDDDEVPVAIMDVDEETARALVTTIDPISGLAEADTAKHRELIDSLQPTSDTVKDFLASVRVDAPDFSNPGSPTQEDIDAASASAFNRYGNSGGDTVELICPECHTEFRMLREDILKNDSSV